MKTRGWGPFKQTFYSACSKHRVWNKDCNTCQKGRWYTNLTSKLSSILFKVSSGIWRVIRNRKQIYSTVYKLYK